MEPTAVLQIFLPDGSIREVAPGTTVGEVAQLIGAGLARSAIAGVVDEKLVDLSWPLTASVQLRIVTMSSPEAPVVFRHSLAHIMAQAIHRLYPGTRFAIGPVIEHGFYYDFDSETAISENDLERIEAEMRKVVAEKISISRVEKSRSEALAEVTADRDPFKTEIISGLEENAVVSFYRQGDFIDLCRGPHLPNTGFAKHFKLMSVAGAYWRGDSRNAQLQRIYGVAFGTKEELDQYLFQLEEARKRDHRRIGAQLDLFSFHDEAPGAPFFHPAGAMIYGLITAFCREVYAREGYQEVRTPLVLDESLWRKSGHWDNFKENMYFTEVDERTYAVKPMNCPGHCLIYKHGLRSYRELPLRLAEFGQVHRFELSGVLHGLTRVRTFVQDDAHLFCTPGQLQDEVVKIIHLIQQVYSAFGFPDFHVELSTRPERSMGTDEMWSLATAALEGALVRSGLPFKLNPGEGAFYGPKIEFHLKDSIGRTWQCGTAQVDFSMPARLGLEYVAPDGSRQIPVMIHRAILGSVERFLGILLEHHAGALPVWLAPVQVAILPISERFADAVQDLHQVLVSRGIRATVDLGSEKIGYKIRESQIKKVPYMIIFGEKELESGMLTVRLRSGENLSGVGLETFVSEAYFPRPVLKPVS